MPHRLLISSVVPALFVWFSSAVAIQTLVAETTEQVEARQALHKAVKFFRNEVSAQGGYLWQYSADLKYREGEDAATATQGWIQPPGTPSIGEAYLFAYESTGDAEYLDAARETAMALVSTQLQSGGWDNRIEFDPQERKKYAYRVDERTSGRNVSTLDDNKTQSAIRLLMHVDMALDFKDRKIHEAAIYALDHLADAQYPNGAWPQQFSEPPDPDRFPVLKASYPRSWSRTFPGGKYSGFYTFNDNSIADDIDLMLEASKVYASATYRASAEQAGDFILMAQMPAPQPAWAQQYDLEMHPAWARKFEPPSITGGESQGVMRVLMQLYRETGKKKFLDPIPNALEYLKNSRREDGKLARFYELKTNKPLYFTLDYALTYSDKSMPTHYAFVVSSKLDQIEAEYRKVAEYKKSAKQDPAQVGSSGEKLPPRLSKSIVQRGRRAIDAMDSRGAWTEAGTLRRVTGDDAPDEIISCRTFIENVEDLSNLIRARD